MTLMNMITHTHKSTYLYVTPEAEPRGILWLKTSVKYNTIVNNRINW